MNAFGGLPYVDNAVSVRQLEYDGMRFTIQCSSVKVNNLIFTSFLVMHRLKDEFNYIL